MSYRKFSLSNWNNRHFARTEEFAHRIQMIYQTGINEAARLAITLNVDPDKPFSFADYPTVQARVAALMQDMASSMQTTIQSGQAAEWSFANQKNDAFVQSLSALSGLPSDRLDRYMNRNLEVLSAFQQRKEAGMGLSDRIWKYTGQFKRELELGLDIGLGEGRSAQEISQGLRTYLNDPEKLFRRVRNKRGSLVLSKAAEDYHPGQGTYRSSFKNAMRLARTEINMAYRESDHLRHLQLDFVVGIEVRRSNNPYGCDVCESLKGRYPKTFKFVGWHPNCRCHVVSILATPDELRQLNRMILADGDTSTFTSVNEVTEVNPNFTSWVDDHRDRLLRARTLPFFVRDNYTGGDIRQPLSFATLPGSANTPTIDLSRFIKGDVPTNVEIKAAIRELAGLRPEWFTHQLGDISILQSKAYMMQCSTIYDPRTNRWTSKTDLSISTHEFGIGSVQFNPAEELRMAFASMKNGIPLTFHQEYALESLWHELLHAQSKTPPRKLNRSQLQDMETLNEFIARHTYPDLLAMFGVQPLHQTQVLNSGYGYRSWVANFRTSLAKRGLPEQQVVSDLLPVLMDDYRLISGKLASYLKSYPLLKP